MTAPSIDERNQAAFSPDPQQDLLWPLRDVIGWSENMFFQFWDEDRKVGLYSHIGRVREDPTLFRACVVVYLSGKRLVVHRSYGRARDERGPRAGPFTVCCLEPGKRWHVAFDGVGELTDSERTTKGLVGAGTSRPMKFDLEFRATSPTYDKFAAQALRPQAYAVVHHEQAFLVSGSFAFDGRSESISGAGFRDHSVGARDLSGFGGNILFYGATPQGRVIQTLCNFHPDGTVRLTSAFMIENGQGSIIDVIDFPKVRRISSEIGPFDVNFSNNGQPIKIAGEMLHFAALTIHRPNDWSLGADIDGANNPLIIMETPCRITWPDGEVGYGNLELNFPLDRLNGH